MALPSHMAKLPRVFFMCRAIEYKAVTLEPATGVGRLTVEFGSTSAIKTVCTGLMTLINLVWGMPVGWPLVLYRVLQLTHNRPFSPYIKYACLIVGILE